MKWLLNNGVSMKTEIPVAEKTATPTLLVHLTENDLAEIIRREVSAALSGLPILSKTTIPEPETELMTRAEVCKLFGVSMPTLIRWAKEKTLPCLRFNRSVRYRVCDVKRLLQFKKGSNS